jgi:hypothetical protein
LSGAYFFFGFYTITIFLVFRKRERVVLLRAAVKHRAQPHLGFTAQANLVVQRIFVMEHV